MCRAWTFVYTYDGSDNSQKGGIEMPITHRHAMRYMGQPVMVHLHDGKRCCGILRHVNGEGIFIEPMRGEVRPVSSKDEALEVVTADQGTELELEQVLWGWWFFPFLATAALFPFFWW